MSGSIKGYCARCGTLLIKHESGATLACCNGVGYWANAKPLDKDLWWEVPKKGDFYLFKTVFWLNKWEAVFPKE